MEAGGIEPPSAWASHQLLRACSVFCNSLKALANRQASLQLASNVYFIPPSGRSALELTRYRRLVRLAGGQRQDVATLSREG